MKKADPLELRLKFLARVTEKECGHLLATDSRLFDVELTESAVIKIATDPLLAERLDAFVARFGRLQDTVGDKLLPSLLEALFETPGPAIDNLDKAERFGLIESANDWMQMRRLRNQMVHEYIEDMAVLSSALRSGHAFVPKLVQAARACIAEVERVLSK